MLSDKALGELAETEDASRAEVSQIARETLRLRKECRALRKFLEARDLWATYQEEARASPAAKPAGRRAGKPAGAAV